MHAYEIMEPFSQDTIRKHVRQFRFSHRNFEGAEPFQRGTGGKVLGEVVNNLDYSSFSVPTNSEPFSEAGQAWLKQYTGPLDILDWRFVVIGIAVEAHRAMDPEANRRRFLRKYPEFAP